MLDHAGQLRTLIKVQAHLKELKSYLEKGRYHNELINFRKINFDQVIYFSVVKSWWSWQAFSVAMFGVAQIAAGIALEVYSINYHTIL